MTYKTKKSKKKEKVSKYLPQGYGYNKKSGKLTVEGYDVL